MMYWAINTTEMCLVCLLHIPRHAKQWMYMYITETQVDSEDNTDKTSTIILWSFNRWLGDTYAKILSFLSIDVA